MTRTEETSSKTARDTMTNITMTSSLAKEAVNTSTTDSSRTSSNRRSRENKCSNGTLSTENRICLIELIYYRCG